MCDKHLHRMSMMKYIANSNDQISCFAVNDGEKPLNDFLDFDFGLLISIFDGTLGALPHQSSCQNKVFKFFF